MSNLPPVKIETKDYCGWKAVQVSNGLVSLIAVPDIGGRVMALEMGGYDFLYIDPSLVGKLFTAEEHVGDGSPNAWKNYGGDKTWPAPQGWENDDQWHGPPDPILDGGRYTLKILEANDDAATIEMISAADPKTGVQISRRITLIQGSSRVNLDLSFTNTSNRARRWSIWDVTQLRSDKVAEAGVPVPDSDCVVTAPLNPHSRFPDGYHVMFARQDNPQWTADRSRGLFIARYQFEIGKIGLDSHGGWIAFYNGTAKTSFVVNYPYFEGAEYPDGGASLECWTVGRGKIPGLNYDYEDSGIYLMETEVLSPIFDFTPGETRSFNLEWGVCRAPGMVVDAKPAGSISQPLVTRRTSDGLQFSGEFGVYDLGKLQVAWLDPEKGALKTQDLMRVGPVRPVLMDETLPVPQGAVSVCLQVVSESDQAARFLAEAAL